MGKSKKSTTTNTTNNEPAAYAAPHLKEISGIANKLYHSGTGFNPYEGQTYAGMSGTTGSALNSMENQAQTGDILSWLSSQQGLNFVGNEGLTSAQQGAGNVLNMGANASALRADDRQFADMYGRTASTAVGDNLGGYAEGRGFSNYVGDRLNGTATEGAWNPNAISQNLSGTARGDDIGNDPYLNQMLDMANQRTANSVNAQFSAAGRYGSGSHGGKLAEQIGANELSARSAALESARNRQLQANQMLSGEQQQGFANRMGAITQVGNEQNQNILQRMQAAQAVGNESAQNYQSRLAALQGMTGVQGQNAGLSLQAANSLGQLGQQGASNVAQFAGLAPTLYDQNFADERTQLGVGQAREGYQQGAMDDAKAMWDEQQLEDAKRLEFYNNAVRGSSDGYGSSISISTKK
jgi:hypothetical protein